MLQHHEPGDFVVATGEAHSVREFCELAFAHVGLDWREYVECDPRYLRPTEVDYLLGDPSKARAAFNWQPRCRFEDLVKTMVEADLRLARSEHGLREAGHELAAAGNWASH
ncbi:MAG: GDP-mannose 4,6-dehydratase, partial [Bryobacterales bacterium]|nr:GDP-mannose 4,6-dehydratase [Bryobacterales bacterium]